MSAWSFQRCPLCPFTCTNFTWPPRLSGAHPHRISARSPRAVSHYYHTPRAAFGVELLELGGKRDVLVRAVLPEGDMPHVHRVMPNHHRHIRPLKLPRVLNTGPPDQSLSPSRS
eukprot:8628582-Pyramimonas_sp.AAC.1